MMKLPDEVYEQLRHMLGQGEKFQWKIGDFIEEIWIEVLNHLPPYVVNTQTGERIVDYDRLSRLAHADLIRDLAENTGADKSTLNDRQNMANFFPKPIREKYDMLTYSQLRACKSAGPDDWEKWAQWALVNGYNGRPAGVHTIRRAINKAEDPTPDWVNRLKKLEELVEKLITDDDTPAYVKEILRDCQVDLQFLKPKELA
jgi:hypothetical protein